MAALTAWQMLDAARVAPGQRILVSGASGGVGHVAVQLARARGADVVSFADWREIEAAEAARARPGSPREKFVAVAEMLAARGR